MHAEDAIGDNEASPGTGSLLETALEVVDVGMGVTESARLAETNSVDDARVIELIGDHCILGTEDRLEEAAVGIETRGVEDGVVEPEEAGDFLLEFLVDVLGAADEANRGEPESVAVEGTSRRFDDFRVAREAEVVVRAEIERLAIDSLDSRSLGTGDDPLRLVETRIANLLQFGDEFLAIAVHPGLLWLLVDG